MKVISVKDRIKWVLDEINTGFCIKGSWKYVLRQALKGRSSEEIGWGELNKLIGHEGVSLIKCDECNREFEEVIRIDVPSEGYITFICYWCLTKAAKKLADRRKPDQQTDSLN